VDVGVAEVAEELLQFELVTISGPKSYQLEGIVSMRGNRINERESYQIRHDGQEINTHGSGYRFNPRKSISGWDAPVAAPVAADSCSAPSAFKASPGP
jgi:hypothetical protein